jgi:hypothetical protein
MVEGSTMSLDPPANQPAQSGGGDVLTHATKNIAVMTMGSSALVVAGKDVCATGDIAALNVMTAESSVAQVQMPLLEAADFEAARAAAAAAAAEMVKKWRAGASPQSPAVHGRPPRRSGHRLCRRRRHRPERCPASSRWCGPAPMPLRAPRLGARWEEGGWTHSFEQWVEVTEDWLSPARRRGLARRLRAHR